MASCDSKKMSPSTLLVFRFLLRVVQSQKENYSLFSPGVPLQGGVAVLSSLRRHCQAPSEQHLKHLVPVLGCRRSVHRQKSDST